jgi:hypothetical protein
LLWEFYILYFYGIIIAKKLWNYKKIRQWQQIYKIVLLVEQSSTDLTLYGSAFYNRCAIGQVFYTRLTETAVFRQT